MEAYARIGVQGLPAQKVWEQLMALPETQAVTLVNFFKFRANAAYPADYAVQDTHVSGKQAFDRYAATSGNCLSRAGGHFLLVAPFGGTFLGEDQSWDLVAIGTYPSASALLSLFEQAEYRSIYVHRAAACEDQQVGFVLG